MKAKMYWIYFDYNQSLNLMRNDHTSITGLVFLFKGFGCIHNNLHDTLLNKKDFFFFRKNIIPSKTRNKKQ